MMRPEIGLVVRKRLFLILPIVILIAWSTAACNSRLKTADRNASGTATLTPFLVKATYTSTSTPMSAAGEPVTSNVSNTATAEPTLQEDTGEVEVLEEHAHTPSSTATRELGSPKPSSTLAPIKPPAKTNTPKPPADTNTPQPPADTNTPKPPPDTDTPPSPTTAVCAPSGNNSYEQQVITLINQERADEGLPALVQNASLTQAARRHSQDMACTDTWSHTGSDGSTPFTRMIDAGYIYSWAAENIAASSSQNFSPSSVVSMWMNSDGHRANILSPNAVHIGVGFRYADNGGFDAYYTADFGRP